MFGLLSVSVKRADLSKHLKPYENLISQVPEKYKRYWEWFFAFSTVPRQSWDHEYAAPWVTEKLLEIGIPASSITQDEAPNVIARIPASKGFENARTLCVQAHMDVALHNTAEDLPYRVNLVDDWFVANETLLGADDGVGIAWMFLTAEERDLFNHGPIELLFTSDEEVGLVGMNYLPGPDDPNGLKAKDIINIDFFDSDKFAYASAGSIRFQIDGERTLESVSGNQFGEIEFSITGMIGGHSGMNMINGRPTPQDWIARCMAELIENNIEFRISEYSSGDAANVLPVNGRIRFVVPLAKLQEAKTIISNEFAVLQKEYEQVKLSQASFDINITEELTNIYKALSPTDSIQFIDSIFGMFHGILYFVDKAIYTSNNVAKIDLIIQDDHASATFLIMPRTHIDGHLDMMRRRVKSFMRTYNFNSVKELASSHPWNGDPESNLAMTFRESYHDITGTEIEPVVFHAGVEAGKFAVRGYTDANVINFGADTINAHTIGESVKNSTTNTKTDVFRLFLQKFADPDFNPPVEPTHPPDDNDGWTISPLISGAIGFASCLLLCGIAFLIYIKMKKPNKDGILSSCDTPLL